MRYRASMLFFAAALAQGGMTSSHSPCDPLYLTFETSQVQPNGPSVASRPALSGHAGRG